jgi:hypothetical protein
MEARIWIAKQIYIYMELWGVLLQRLLKSVRLFVRSMFMC